MPDRFEKLKEVKKKFITVEFFFKAAGERFKLEQITKLDIPKRKKIFDKNLHRPGLALAGYVELFTYQRIQVLGNTEIKYLTQLNKKKRIDSLMRFFSFNVPCVIITNDNPLPVEFIHIAQKFKIPVFKTPYPTTRFIYLVSDFLDDQFAPQIVIHGSFVDVYGIGVLFCGKSGIGKSEIALDLVERGHRLVADDVVLVSKKGESVLMGSGTEFVQHFMEIRGLGIIDIRKVFGIRAIRFQKRVEVIVELEHWDPGKVYERTGLNTVKGNIMGVEIEMIRLPIFPGKNITVISEVIALNYLCKHYGYDAAKVFAENLKKKIRLNKKSGKGETSASLRRAIEYFEHDFE
ncbi:MAG: HPr kinase/phosphorylase [Ignavibacteria bacterium]|nr:HPr kinase/phosphorylase [Ignavibacteria bacterium]